MVNGLIDSLVDTIKTELASITDQMVALINGHTGDDLEAYLQAQVSTILAYLIDSLVIA